METRSSVSSVAAALVASLAVGVAAAQPDAASIGEAAPDFVLKSASGSNLRLSEYRGEVVVVAFWASWCGDCRGRLEELGMLTERYADLGLRTLAVSLDAERSQARRAADAMRAPFPVLFDEAGDVGELYAADSIPMVALVDRSGTLRGTFTGRGDDVGLAIRERVRDLLRE